MDPVAVSVIALAVLFMVNMPVGFAIALATLLYFDSQQSLQVGLLFQRMISGTESFPLLAVPFFLMAGVMMNYAGITPRLIGLADALTGHRVGGLAQVNVVANTLMGGLSGSANADAAVMSKVMVPAMVAKGYPLGFASAITASAALIGPIIPPGIGLIIYGFLANVSIGRMFMAGVIPGILMCGALMVMVDIVSKRRGYKPSRERKATASETWASLRVAGPALLLPLAIIGGIRFGVFTPTEAGAMAVVYGAIIGAFMYRELKPRHLPMILQESLTSTAVVMFIVAAASAFGWMLSYEQLPQRTADFLTSLSSDRTVILLLLNVALLIAGCFIEGTAILIIVTPILVPTAQALGIDLVHFGIILVINLTIGGITPPLGTVMYTTCSITRATVGQFARENMPFLAILILVLVLLTYIPILSTFLPNLLMGT